MEHKIYKTDKEVVGRSFDGSYRFTVSAILGLFLFVAGIVISVYMDAIIPFGVLIGVPIAILGLLIPILMNYNILSEKRR